MSERGNRTVVTVVIAGEEYAIRADATPDYARECAAYVNRTIAEIERQGALVEVHKAAILAALALTDQLFQARAQVQALTEDSARLAAKLTADIEARTTSSDLA